MARQALSDELIRRLPEFPVCSPLQTLEVVAEFGGQAGMTQIRHDSLQGIRLSSADGLHVIQVTRDGIAFSRLSPYEDWGRFLNSAWRAWQSFLELARPIEVLRLGVRFINRIALKRPEDVRSVLTSPPECLESVSFPVTTFLYQSRHVVPGHPFEISVARTIQSQVTEPDEEFFLIVDIDAGSTQAFACDQSVLQNHLNSMHWLKNKVFFSLLTPDAIKRFME